MDYELSFHDFEMDALHRALELPESVELLEHPEATAELPEAQTETRELHEGVEVDSRTREQTEQTELSPFRYSEAYIDQNGRYHPRQIDGVYTSAMEDPDHRVTAESLSDWQRQERRMSCAVAVQRMILNGETGAELTEAQLREEGEILDWYTDERGTYTHDVGNLAMLHGMEREQYDACMSLQELIEAEAQGDRLILGVDHALLAYPYLPKPTTPDHAVELLDFDFSDPENPLVILNDPGRADGRGAAYPLSIFERAACIKNPDTGEQVVDHVTILRMPKEANAS